MPERWTRKTEPKDLAVGPRGAPRGGSWIKSGHWVEGTVGKWWVRDGWEYIPPTAKQPLFVEPTFAAMSAAAMEKKEGGE